MVLEVVDTLSVRLGTPVVVSVPSAATLRPVLGFTRPARVVVAMGALPGLLIGSKAQQAAATNVIETMNVSIFLMAHIPCTDTVPALALRIVTVFTFAWIGIRFSVAASMGYVFVLSELK